MATSKSLAKSTYTYECSFSFLFHMHVLIHPGLFVPYAWNEHSEALCPAMTTSVSREATAALSASSDAVRIANFGTQLTYWD